MFARVAVGSLVLGLILALVGACTAEDKASPTIRPYSTSLSATRQARTRATVLARSTERAAQTETARGALGHGCVYGRLPDGSVIDTCSDAGSDDDYRAMRATEYAAEEATEAWEEYQSQRSAPEPVDVDAERADATEYALEKAAAEVGESDTPADVAAFVDAPEEDWSGCDPAYPDFCIPPLEMVGDLDCDDVDGSYFTVYDPDPHGFDGDYDGVGCEWP